MFPNNHLSSASTVFMFPSSILFQPLSFPQLFESLRNVTFWYIYICFKSDGEVQLYLLCFLFTISIQWRMELEALLFSFITYGLLVLLIPIIPSIYIHLLSNCSEVPFSMLYSQILLSKISFRKITAYIIPFFQF